MSATQHSTSTSSSCSQRGSSAPLLWGAQVCHQQTFLPQQHSQTCTRALGNVLLKVLVSILVIINLRAAKVQHLNENLEGGGRRLRSGAGANTPVFTGVTKCRTVTFLQPLLKFSVRALGHPPPGSEWAWLQRSRQPILVIDCFRVHCTSDIHRHFSCSHGNSFRFALPARVRTCPVLTSIMYYFDPIVQQLRKELDTVGLLQKVQVKRITKLSTCHYNRWQLRHGSRSLPEITNVRFVLNRIIPTSTVLSSKWIPALRPYVWSLATSASVWLHCPLRLTLVMETLRVFPLAMACLTVASDHLITMAILYAVLHVR